MNINRNSRPHLFSSSVIICILLTETAERFTYFGFRAILIFYLQEFLSESEAVATFAYTTAAAYASPAVGAYVADVINYGRYRTILWFGVIYAAGLIVLTVAAVRQSKMQKWTSYAGLFLICLGTGGIKPCVSAFGADQVTALQKKRLPREEEEEPDGLCRSDTRQDTQQQQQQQQLWVQQFFSYFYFCINLGALTSIAIVPVVKKYTGFGVAFLLPTLFMIVALLLFISKRHDYVHAAPDAASLRNGGNVFGRMIQLFLSWQQRRPTQRRRRCSDEQQQHDNSDSAAEQETHNILASSNATDDDHVDAALVLHVLPILLTLPIFWCLYDQQGSVWTLQAERMNLKVFAITLQPEQLTLINPLEIMLFIPAFESCIYPTLRRYNVDIRPLRRMGWGMILTTMSFLASGLVESTLTVRQLHVFWQLPQLTLLAVGEIFLSVTGLEFVYSTAPVRLRALLLGMFYLTTACGDLLGGLLYSTTFADMQRSTIMNVCAGLMLANFAFFKCVAAWFERTTHEMFLPVGSRLLREEISSSNDELQTTSEEEAMHALSGSTELTAVSSTTELA